MYSLVVLCRNIQGQILKIKYNFSAVYWVVFEKCCGGERELGPLTSLFSLCDRLAAPGGQWATRR